MEMFPCWRKRKRPRRDLNPQSSDPKSDALSIRPRGQTHESVETIFCFAFEEKLKQLSRKFIETKERVYGRESGRKFVRSEVGRLIH